MTIFLQELCSNLLFHLGKTGAHSEAYAVYNMLRYSEKPMCKDLHEKILYILIAGRLYKDAYVVFKVCYCCFLENGNVCFLSVSLANI